MGNCCTNSEDENLLSEEEEERLPINNGCLTVGISITTSDTLDGFSPPRSVGTNEQSILVDILQQTANDLIDVAALEGVSIRRQDQNLKAKQYSSRLQQLGNSWRTLCTSPNVLPMLGVPCPATVLQDFSVSQSDTQQISVAAEKMAAAIHSMKAADRGQLVAPLTTLA